MGPIIIAMVRMASIRGSRFWPKASFSMTRASVRQPAAPRPCMQRPAIRVSMFGANMQTTLPAPISSRAASSGGRRPKRSASGP